MRECEKMVISNNAVRMQSIRSSDKTKNANIGKDFIAYLGLC